MLVLRIFTYSNFFNLISGTNGTPVKNLEHRIKYFSYKYDFSYMANKDFYVVLFKEEEIIGLIKLGWNPHKGESGKNYWISYISIDERYRGQGHSKEMLNELFKYSKENNYTIEGSSYTEIGKERLPKNIKHYADLYNVVFIPSER